MCQCQLCRGKSWNISGSVFIFIFYFYANSRFYLRNVQQNIQIYSRFKTVDKLFFLGLQFQLKVFDQNWVFQAKNHFNSLNPTFFSALAAIASQSKNKDNNIFNSKGLSIQKIFFQRNIGRKKKFVKKRQMSKFNLLS